jgi:hypothetical protein
MFLESSGLLIGDLFRRWPRICNEYEACGGTIVPASVVSSMKRIHRQDSHEILLEFRESRTVMEMCSTRCSCRQCSHIGTVGPPLSGCLKTMAGSEMLRMIAHAIDDGLGADDVSGISESFAIETITSHLLADLLEAKAIPWEQWFRLAAAVHLGFPTTRIDQESLLGPAYMNSEAVAIQFGSSVVVAPWIDLYSGVQLTGAFGFESAQARLCGVDADWAVLRTEATARTGGSKLDLSEVKLPRHEYDEKDVDWISLQSTIQRTGNVIDAPDYNYHRRGPDISMLITIAKVGRHIRIIDPSDALLASALSHIPRCTHDKSHKHAVHHSLPNRTWTCEEAVGFWEVDNSWNALGVWTYYTTTLDSLVKYNTLLALSPRGCVIKTADCCFACAVNESVTRFPHSIPKRILCTSMDEKSLTRRQR